MPKEKKLISLYDNLIGKVKKKKDSLLYDSIDWNLRKSNHRDGRVVVYGGKGWGESTAEGHEGTFGGNENVLDHSFNGSYVTIYLWKQLKLPNFTIYKLYLDIAGGK